MDHPMNYPMIERSVEQFPAEARLLSFATGATDEFNSRLYELILRKEDELLKRYPLPVSGKPGVTALWTRYNFFEFPESECAELKRVVTGCYRAYLDRYRGQYEGWFPRFVQCWMNVIRSNAPGQPAHSHHLDPRNVAGVYYVGGDFGADNGLTHFWADAADSRKVMSVKPRPGRLLMFPATLPHAFGAYESPRPRVSVAFDIRYEMEPGKVFIPIEEAA